MLTLVSFGRVILDRFPKKRKEGYESPVPSYQLRTFQQKSFVQPRISSASSSEDDLNLSTRVVNQHFPDTAGAYHDHVANADPAADHNINIDIAPLSQKLSSWLAEQLPPDSSLDEKQSFIIQDSLESLIDCAICIYQAGKPFVGENADHLSVDDIRGVFAASVLKTRDPGFRQELVRKILGNSHIQPTANININVNDETQSGEVDTDPPPRSPTLSSITDGFSSARTAVPSLWEVSFNELRGDMQHTEEEQLPNERTLQNQPPQTREICIIDEKLMVLQSHTETVPKHTVHKAVTAPKLGRGPRSTLSGELGGYMEPTAIETQMPGTHKENSTPDRDHRAVYTETMTVESAANKPQIPFSNFDEQNASRGVDICLDPLASGYLLDHISMDSAVPIIRRIGNMPTPPPQSHNQRSALHISETATTNQSGEYLSDSVSRKPRKLRVSFATELSPPLSSNDDDTRLHDAIRRDDLPTVCYLLEKGIDIFKENIHTTIARLPANAIAYCVKYRRKDILSYFVRHDIKCYPTAIWETLRYGDDELREFITAKYKERKSQLDLIRLLSSQNQFVRPDFWDPIVQQNNEYSTLYSQVSGDPDLIDGDQADDEADYSDGDTDDDDDDDDGEKALAALKAVYLILRISLLICGGDPAQLTGPPPQETSGPELLCQCVDGGEDSSIPNGGDTAGVSGSRPRSNQHTRRVPKRSRENRGDKDNDDNDDPNHRPNKKQATKLAGAYGCPYAIGKPEAYRKCLRIQRQDLSGLKEHIKRNHFNGEAPPDLYRRRTWEEIFRFCNPHWSWEVPSPYHLAVTELMEVALRAVGVDPGMSMPDAAPPLVQGDQPRDRGDANLGVAQTPEQRSSTVGGFDVLTAQGGSVAYQPPPPHTPQGQTTTLEPQSSKEVLDATTSFEQMLGDALHQEQVEPVDLPSIPPTIEAVPQVPSEAGPRTLSSPFQPKPQYSITSDTFQRQILGNLATPSIPSIFQDTTSPDLIYGLSHLHPSLPLGETSSQQTETSSQQTDTMLPPPLSSSSPPSLSVDSVNRVIGQSSQGSRKSFPSAWGPGLGPGNMAIAQTPKSTLRSESPSRLSMGHETSTPITQVSETDTIALTPRPNVNVPFSTVDARPPENKKYTISIRYKPCMGLETTWKSFYLNGIDELRRDFNTWMVESFPSAQFSWDRWDLESIDYRERIRNIDDFAGELENLRWFGRQQNLTPFFLVPKQGTMESSENWA